MKNCKKYLKMFSVIIVLVFLINQINAQTGGTTATGDYYVCVPTGFCDNNGAISSPGIDPRIVTPGQLCAAGQVPCYAQGPNSKCSQYFVTPVNTANGGTTVSAHPWQAFIRNSTHPAYAGSGVLIDNYHVLTAAHKVAGDVAQPANVIITMGFGDANAQNRTAARIITHPNYTAATLKNDIAIIRVSQPFSLSQTNINTACLPAAGSSATAYVGQTCLVSGWGETSFKQNNQPVTPMKQVNVNVATYEACRASFANATLLGAAVDTYLDVNYAEVCAGGASQLDACTFDGGAPLMCPSTPKGTLTGLVIWGKGCGQAGVYGVYVAVPYYRGWIDTTLTQLNAR